MSTNSTTTRYRNEKEYDRWEDAKHAYLRTGPYTKPENQLNFGWLVKEQQAERERVEYLNKWWEANVTNRNFDFNEFKNIDSSQ
jgi:hypothetical protein